MAVKKVKRLTIGENALSYRGVNAESPPETWIADRDPLTNDYKNFIIGDLWINSSTKAAFMLTNKDNQVATWIQLAAGAGDVSTLTGNTGGAVGPDGAQNINVVGDATTGVSVTGNPGTNTLTIANGILQEEYEVQTTDATPTNIATFGVGVNEAIIISGHIVGAIDDYSASLNGRFIGGARRTNIGGAFLVGSPVIDINEDSAGNASLNVIVTGNTILVEVIGVAGETWNWKAFISRIIQDT